MIIPMATTNLIPLHTAKGLTAGKSIAKVIKYVKNTEKTENGSLVTAFACNPQIADQEFAYMKRLYIDRTGRKRGKDDVIAYHLRQSFQPEHFVLYLTARHADLQELHGVTYRELFAYPAQCLS